MKGRLKRVNNIFLSSGFKNIQSDHKFETAIKIGDIPRL